MIPKLNWVRLPTAWIAQDRLKEFSRPKGAGSAEIAALMTLIAVAHHADQESGVARITYDRFTEALGISRTLVSEGLDILASRNLITRGVDGRSSFKLVNFDPAAGWAMLPAKRLYNGTQIQAFKDFHLRKVIELDALKLYLIFVAYRDREKNRAYISYQKMSEKTGVKANRIRAALSLLTVNHLIYMEQNFREDVGVIQSYRLPQIETRIHGGTAGRKDVDAMFSDLKAATDADVPF